MFVSMIFMATDPRPVPEGTPEWDEITYDFGMPPVDNFLWWNLPFTRPRMQRQRPQADLDRLQAEFRALPVHEQNLQRWFVMLGHQILENDFALILLNYPRIALVYDANIGEFRGINDEGIFHFGFNYNPRYRFLYATRNSWKRVFGFNDFYDWLSNNLGTLLELETYRVIFEHDGLEYMVQMWKGRYLFNLITGAEVGFYTRPLTRRVEHWDTLPLEQSMPMRLALTSGDTVFFDLPMRDTWWIMMLEHYQTPTPARYLTMCYSADFSNDPALGQAFYAALQEQFPEFNPQKEGYIVSFVWDSTLQ